MKIFNLKVYSDPGHGWLAVPTKTLFLMPIELIAKISRYSYQSDSGKTVYLEEDCDAAIFFEWAIANGHRINQKMVPSNRQSRIRNLGRFRGLS